MIKFKTSKKNMVINYNKIIGLGYCSAQLLLKYKNPIAYSTRTEGWACDYYDIGGILISTGYAPLNSKNTNSNYEIVTKYDTLAQKIVYDYKVPYEDKKALVNDLLKQYILEVVTNDKD